MRGGPRLLQDGVMCQCQTKPPLFQPGGLLLLDRLGLYAECLSAGEGNIPLRKLSELVGRWAMRTYRFVVKTHHDVHAETLEEALKAFHEMQRQGLATQSTAVTRIEVEDEQGHYIPVDRALRAGDLEVRKQAELH